MEPDADVRRRLGDAVPVADRSASLHEVDLTVERPTVLVVGPGAVDPRNFDSLADLTASPLLGAVVVAVGPTTELLQAAMRAGVRDVVELDPTGEAVGRSVARVAELLLASNPALGGVDPVRPLGAPADLRRTSGRIVAVFSPKGGVGKTVVATNVAAALAERCSEPVCLADVDLQYGDVAVALGVPPEHSIVDAAGAAGRDDPGVVRELMTRHRSGLLVLPGPREPMMGLALDPAEVEALCTDLRTIAAVTVVDVPSVFDDATFAVLDAADEILLVASMDIPSIKNLKVGLQAFDLVGLAGPKLRLVLNRATAQVKLDPREVERVLGIPVAFPVPYDVAVPVALNAGESVITHAPRSAAARAFGHIAESVLGDVGTAGPRSRRRR